MNNKISVKSVVTGFNRSALRKQMIPMDMASGWPCIHRMGKQLCITIPYFSRFLGEGQKVALNSIYCSVTLNLRNPRRLMDFTIYPYHPGWDDVDYSNPVGTFPHKALSGIGGREYRQMCDRLYDYYDKLVAAVMEKVAFEEEQQMIELFSQLMEPAHYPQYLRINKKFYSNFCTITQGDDNYGNDL